MKTIAEAQSIFDERLKHEYDRDELNALKYLVLSELCGLGKTQIRAFGDQLLTEQQVQRLDRIIAEMITGKPVQYVLGFTEFYGLRFIVDPSVLIPRPETEELVEWVLNETQKEKMKNQERRKLDAEGRKQEFETNKQEKVFLKTLKILDIGAGSGCISISLKKNLPDAEVSGFDISHTALAIARQNAILNQVNVNFFQGDVFKIEFDDKDYSLIGAERLSMIVSNPPYVTNAEKVDMHNNVLNYEPHNALFVPNYDPLIFYKAITRLALQNLEPDGLLFLEINENLGIQTVELLRDKSFIDIVLKQDLRGKDRMVKARLGDVHKPVG